MKVCVKYVEFQGNTHFFWENTLLEQTWSKKLKLSVILTLTLSNIIGLNKLFYKNFISYLWNEEKESINVFYENNISLFN